MSGGKTNAMRLLDRSGVVYEAREYAWDQADLSGVTAAQKLGLPPAQVFKTLVARGERRGILVAVIPVDRELDLKALAKAAGDKKIEMLPLRDLLAVTGYQRGGCSPVGMKKQYPTFLEESAQAFVQIGVSAGRRGLQLLLAPGDLLTATGGALFSNK